MSRLDIYMYLMSRRDQLQPRNL